MRQVMMAQIELREPFASMLPSRLAVEDALIKNMEDEGFDPAFPVVLWNNVLIDGFHRFRAAKRLGFLTVPVVDKIFSTEREALIWAVHVNAQRRQLTDAELLVIFDRIDNHNKEKAKEKSVSALNESTGAALDPEHGAPGEDGSKKVHRPRPEHSAPGEDPHERSAKATAEDLQISERKVKDMRTLTVDGTETDKAAVKAGQKSVHQVAKEIRQRKDKDNTDPEASELRRYKNWLNKIAMSLELLISDLDNNNWKYLSRQQVTGEIMRVLKKKGD